MASQVVCVLVLGLLAASAAAATSGPRGASRGWGIGPVAPWVERVDVDREREAPKDQVSGGIDYLLVDRQTRVAARSLESFAHYAKKIVNEAGLESTSQLSLEFDPSYQRLTLHSVRVLRAGASLNRLFARKIQILQRESDLESQVYDGTLSAVLFLEDVRVGDVIEYAYTLTGTNPIFEGRYDDSFSTEWGVPIERMRWRLLWPEGRPLFVRNHNTTLESTRTSGPGETAYLWEQLDVPPRVSESGEPRWYDGAPWVQLSEYETWAQVAAWGEKRFARPPTLSAPLRARIAQWRGAAPEDAVLAALRFVQDEVRYLGIEIGVHSHQPNDPNLVFARRFGDCKDKVMLLNTILHELGIVAHPALVHSTLGQGLDAWQPTPTAFDHVVTLVEVEGHPRWVDPTLTSQGGTLPELHFPDYRRALVLRAGTAALAEIAEPNVATPVSTVRETFVVKDYTSPVEFTVESRFQGAEANRMRSDVRSHSRQELERRYLKFYAQTYPQVKALQSMEVKDDRPANLLTVRERYSIPEFWSLSEDQERRLELTPSSIDELIQRPRTGARTAPLSIRYPVHVQHVTELSLPTEWSIHPESKVVGGKTMRFSYRSTYANRHLRLEYTYRSLADSVAPADLPAHTKEVDRIRGLLTFELTSPLTAAKAAAKRSAGMNWVVAALATVFLGLSLLGAILVYRYRPSPPARRVGLPLPAPLAIGGWLLLVGFGILVFPLRLWVGLGAMVPTYALDKWLALTAPGAEHYHALWAPLLIFELLGNIFFAVCSILVAILFVRRRRSLPLVYIVFLSLNTLFLLADTLLATAVSATRALDAGAIGSLVGLFAGMAIWIPYFLFSKRAKDTFVR